MRECSRTLLCCGYEEWCGSSPDRVDDHGAVDAMPVAGVLPEERRRGVLRLRGKEPVVAAQTPAAVWRIPLHAAADVASQERLGRIDAEVRLLEHGESADAARRVGNDGRVGWCRQ